MRVVPPAADTGADLARLRRPTGPWLHLLDAAPADARQLGWLLGRDGVVVRILRGHCGRSAYGFLDEAGAALQLPGDPAEDWTSLAVLLTDLSWLPGVAHVLVVTRASLLLAAEPVSELRGLVEATREVARGRAEEGDPVPFHLVLQDDAVGLAALRVRLDAVGAKHVDLSGWYAEEPAAETVVGARSAFAAGDERPDEVDAAVGAAVSEVDGMVELRRGWEEFRGPAGGVVRVYAPVLSDPRRGVHVASVVARAAAAAGSACVAVPLPSAAAGRDARQAAVAAAATVVWPVPALPPEPTAPAEVPAAEAPPPPVAEPRAAEPRADQVSADEPRADQIPAAESRADEAPAARPRAPEPPAAEPPAAEPPAAEPRADQVPAAESRAPEPPAAESRADKAPAAGPRAPERRPAREPEAPGPEVDRPGDEPGMAFELVAASLEWTFDSGPAGADPVDAALAEHAAAGGRTAALFRTWVRDPDHGWVRVVLAYVGPRGSIAEVEAERTAVVDVLRRAGAARCCVEVLAASDVTDVHRWLEARCRPLWPPTHAAPPDPRPSHPTPALSSDAPLAPGPAAGDPDHAAMIAELVRWADDRAGVVGIVTAWVDLDGTRTLVVGVALDGRTDPDAVRAEVAPLAPAALVEPFAPSRGLDPAHLRLTRSSTRVWTRRAERAQPRPNKTTGTLDRPSPPDVVSLGPRPSRDTADPRADLDLGGLTLIGIDRDVPITKGPPTPDERDRALMAWARKQPNVIALLRGIATVADDEIPVYCLCVTETADPEVARRDLAAAVAATGTTRAAAEAFAPAGAIPAFHLDLAVSSTRLWPAPA